jgi:ubiquinone/menaquinone biosynthesis C-methylase UbiE
MSEPIAERERSQRERGHFENVVEASDDLYWADRTPAAGRRQEIRGRRLREAAELDASSRVLDIGCGTGAYTGPLSAGCNARFVALDVAPALLRVARERTGSNVEVTAADAGELPFADESFDAVVGNAVLHHLPLDRSLPELLRILKPGGRFCFAEPNLLNPQVFLERKIPLLRKWLENSPDEIAFARWSLATSLKAEGLIDVECVPFDFLYPLTPKPLIGAVAGLGSLLERIPLIREIAGSILIRARKPVA